MCVRAVVGVLVAVLTLIGCSAESPEAARNTPVSRTAAPSQDTLNAKADALAQGAEKADRELAQVLDRSRAADKAALDARTREIAMTQPLTLEAQQSPSNPSRTATRQAGDTRGNVPQEPVTMEQRAAAMFGPTLSSTRTVVIRFSQGYDRYMQACEGKTTQGGWLMILGDPRSSTGFSSYTAQTETTNATTPECRMLSVDVLSDAKQIGVNLNAVANAAHSAGIWPGVMRDLYAKYDLEEVVSVVGK